MKILYCEDYASLRKTVKSFLLSNNKITTIDDVEDGEATISMLKKEPYDLVILAMKRLGIDNIETLRIIKKGWPSTPVLIVTFKLSEESALEALDLGASIYHERQYSYEFLETAIETIAQGKKYITEGVADLLAKGGITEV